jgi:outer membrane protein OmpA-like peptidoglycan-associated protein
MISRLHIYIAFITVGYLCACSVSAAESKRMGVKEPVVYANGINTSSWRSRVSVFECTLVHSVPFYGDAVFRTRAGEASGFYLKALSSRFQAGNAELVSKSPVWKTEQVSLDLGQVPVKRGRRPMWLGSSDTERMLSELNQGMEIEFIKDAWYEDKKNPPMHLAMSSIGFREQYRRYQHCLTGLLPQNFDQLERTALYFNVSKPETADELDPDVTRKLDNILKLVKHDNKIRLFFIDGHTSSPGDRADNLELSKTRAELVANYLKRRGLPEDWLKVRWHGERYPVASNASAAGRAKNRRVTVRMERVEEVEVLPLSAK